MNDLLPLAPQVGLFTHWYLLLVLGIGTVFGFALERAGFGSAKNLSAIFILRDFRVFRVMFSAVLTAMLGAHLLHFLGLMNLSLLPIEPNFFWSIALGGVVFGVGFYIGGFCPGTAVVAVARGRWDGLAFLFGIVLGIFVFAELFDAVGGTQWFTSFYAPSDAAPTTLYGSGPAWPWIVGITAAAFMGFWITPMVEKRFGLRTVKELRDGRADEEGTAPPAASKPSLLRWVAPAGVGVVLLAVIVSEVSMAHPDLMRDRPRAAPVLAGEESELGVSAQTLAGWMIEEAHRRENGSPDRLLVLDKRPEEVRRAAPVPRAFVLDVEGETDLALVSRVVRELRTLELPKDADLVILGSDDEATSRLVADLRRRRVAARILEGGSNAWQREVLGWEPDDLALTAASRQSFAAVWAEVRAWLVGEREDLPPRFVFPGAVPPKTAVKGVAAIGTGAGGGCN